MEIERSIQLFRRNDSLDVTEFFHTDESEKKSQSLGQRYRIDYLVKSKGKKEISNDQKFHLDT